MFPAADERGRVQRVRRPSPARRSGRRTGGRDRSTSTPPTAPCTTSVRCCFGVHLARRPRPLKQRPDDPGRGLHRRACAASGGDPQRGGHHGHLVHRGAARRARAGPSRCSCSAWMPMRPASRPSCGPRAWLAVASSSCRSSSCPRALTRPTWVLSEGADAVRARVENSVPFEQFSVDRILSIHDTDTTEGRARRRSGSSLRRLRSSNRACCVSISWAASRGRSATPSRSSSSG